MFVLSMNSKRQRRPNVRLGEIGDDSAAFACGFSKKTEENFGHKRCRNVLLNYDETQHNPIRGFARETSSELLVSDPGVSPRISADLQQNRENKNPNSSKSAFKLVNFDEIDMTKSKLNFGTVTRKHRVMKRRGRSTTGYGNVFSSVWSSKLSPQFSNEDGTDCGVKEFVGFKSDACTDYCHANDFTDILDHGTLATGKEACEYGMERPTYDVGQQENFDDIWQEGTCYEHHDVSPVSGYASDEMKFQGDDVDTVSRWLDKQGFSKYAGLFEMHEVDEEALPLLTIEDLKEMGVFAVGPRRKLYTAIQQLRKEDVSV